MSEESTPGPAAGGSEKKIMWVYLSGAKLDKVYGPIEEEKLKAMFQDGTLNGGTCIRRETDSTWVLAAQSIFASLAGPPVKTAEKAPLPWLKIVLGAAVTLVMVVVIFRPGMSPSGNDVQGNASQQSTTTTAVQDSIDAVEARVSGRGAICKPPERARRREIAAGKLSLEQRTKQLQNLATELEAQKAVLDGIHPGDPGAPSPAKVNALTGAYEHKLGKYERFLSKYKVDEAVLKVKTLEYEISVREHEACKKQAAAPAEAESQ